MRKEPESVCCETPDEACDLIMEGGITSGVVYPLALVRLAKRYRFASIGGTSAGAIAAGLAAAAEFGRENNSFARLRDLPNELAERLATLFQPTRPLRGIFAAFLAAMPRTKSAGRGGSKQLTRRSQTERVAAALVQLLKSEWWTLLVGGIVAAVYPWSWMLSPIAVLRDALGVFVVIASVLLALVVGVVVRLRKHVPRQFFGFCPGLTQPGHKDPALTDWLTALLDELAGPAKTARHLTFGDLKQANITLKMMTTNLSMQRPHALPMDPTSQNSRAPEFAFNEAEWRRLFPESVIEQIAVSTRAVEGKPGYFYFPEPDDLPVVVGVRMSLSFPVLISAVPLYRKDRTFSATEEVNELRRCFFSDGGITSNFPIHFFDAILPTRPTFAISLEEFDERRQGRVTMPDRAGRGIELPISPVTSLLGFVFAIVNSARNWQDNLQGVLPGYRERIAHVALTEEEGGLNLNMPSELVTRLTEFGDKAGELMLDFDFDEHRWRRFLVAYARIEETMEEFHDAYKDSFGAFLAAYPSKPPGSYKPVSGIWMRTVTDRVEQLFQLATQWRGKSLRVTGRIPKPESELRITPKA